MEAIMFCKHCGNELSTDTKFCPNCGNAQTKANTDTLNDNSSNEYSDKFNFHKWIVDNALDSYEQVLKAEDFDTEDILIGLTESDLDKIEALSIGAKKKILNGIQKLRSETDIYASKKELTGKDGIPDRCPKCGEIWGMAKENSGAGNTLGKALVGGLLLGPLGVIGGAAFGNKTTVYICNKCGFKKEYKSSLAKEAASNIKKIFK